MTVYQSPIRQQLFGERSSWRSPLAAALLAFQLLFIGWLIVRPGGDEALIWFDDISFVLAPSLASLMAGLVAARNWGSRLGYAWALIAAGLLMTAFGETAWGVQEVGLGIEVPFPSIADVGYLGIYPLVFLGLLLMPQAPVSGLRRLRFSLDALIAMLAIAIVSWYLILANLISQSGEGALSKSIAVAYPFADLGIVFAVLILIGRGGRALSGAALACLGGGFLAIAFSDSLYTYLTSVKDYASGNYIDIGWLLGYNLVTLAALIALSRRISFEHGVEDDDESPSVWGSLFPYVPVLLLASLDIEASLSSSSRSNLDLFLGTGTTAVFALVIIRQVVSIYENTRLNRELVSLAAQLQIKVKSQSLQLLRRSGPSSSEPAGLTKRPNGADEPVGGLRPGEL